MNGAEVLDIARDAVWITLQTAAPIMLIGLAVGVAIALVQALTQIQEMTLAFVPKIVAIFAALILFLPFMGASMGGLATRVFERIAAM
jgi:flagellar biosynthetic protein FliQ